MKKVDYLLIFRSVAGAGFKFLFSRFVSVLDVSSPNKEANKTDESGKYRRTALSEGNNFRAPIQLHRRQNR